MAERNEKKKRKKKTEPKMGYCPFEHWLGTGTGVGAGMGARDATDASGTQERGRYGHRRVGRWGARAR